MGGEVSKRDLVIEDGKPRNFFRLEGEFSWICGGAIPAFNENIEFLKKKNIKHIVSLCIDPLKYGLNINHAPFDHDHTEWVLGDDLDLNSFNLHHVPMADAGCLYEEQAKNLLRVMREIQEKEENIYLHCWLGKGRTATAILYTLMNLYNKTLDGVFQILIAASPKHEDVLKPVQLKFLKGKKMTEQEFETFLPIIKTPSDHKVWTIK